MIAGGDEYINTSAFPTFLKNFKFDCSLILSYSDIMTQRMLSLVYASESSSAQLVSIVTSNGRFRLVPPIHDLHGVRSRNQPADPPGSAGKSKGIILNETALNYCQ